MATYKQQRRLAALNQPKLHLFDRLIVCRQKRVSRYTPDEGTFLRSSNRCSKCESKLIHPSQVTASGPFMVTGIDRSKTWQS